MWNNWPPKTHQASFVNSIYLSLWGAALFPKRSHLMRNIKKVLDIVRRLYCSPFSPSYVIWRMKSLQNTIEHKSSTRKFWMNAPCFKHLPPPSFSLGFLSRTNWEKGLKTTLQLHQQNVYHNECNWWFKLNFIYLKKLSALSLFTQIL